MSRKSKSPPGRGGASANEQGKGYGQISRVMIESFSYRAIKTIAAAKALPVFLVKFGHAEATTGRPECEFSYTEAGKLHGIARKSFSRGIQELHALGLIDAVSKGGEWEGNRWTTSVYRKSERWRKYGTGDFIQTEWVPAEPSQRPKLPAKVGRDG